MKLITFDTINSTNTWALENFENLDDETVVIANQQTNGRGRFDRVWVSGDYENIYMSIVLKPMKKDFLVNLTQYLCLAVTKVLKNYDVKSEIKWPNDVLINGKKVCGILCESKLKKNVIQGIVLGIGINLNMPEEIINQIDRPATSLNLVLNRKIDKQLFLEQLLDEFFANYKKVVEDGFLYIKNDYINSLSYVNQKVYIQKYDGDVKEQVFSKTVDDFGNLIIIDENQKERTILSGDILF